MTETPSPGPGPLPADRSIAAGATNIGRKDTSLYACNVCRKPIDLGDVYCRHCGRRQALSEAWYYHPVVILLLGLLVIGPFVLPLIWRAPTMTTAMRWALTIIIVGYAIVTFFYAYKFFVAIFGHFSQIFDIQRQLQ